MPGYLHGSHTDSAKKANGLLRGNRPGRLISEDERKQFIIWINEATESGARLAVACHEVNISLRTWRRWQHSPCDRRPDAIRLVSPNQVSAEEENRIRDICHKPEYASLPPATGR